MEKWATGGISATREANSAAVIRSAAVYSRVPQKARPDRRR